jgi:hypothetical protein
MSYGGYVCKPREAPKPSGPHYWYATKRGEKDTWFKCQCGLEKLGVDLYHQPVPEEKDLWPT